MEAERTSQGNWSGQTVYLLGLQRLRLIRLVFFLPTYVIVNQNRLFKKLGKKWTSSAAAKVKGTAQRMSFLSTRITLNNTHSVLDSLCLSGCKIWLCIHWYSTHAAFTLTSLWQAHVGLGMDWLCNFLWSKCPLEKNPRQQGHILNRGSNQQCECICTRISVCLCLEGETDSTVACESSPLHMA